MSVGIMIFGLGSLVLALIFLLVSEEIKEIKQWWKTEKRWRNK